MEHNKTKKEKHNYLPKKTDKLHKPGQYKTQRSDKEEKNIPNH